jgi:hypothetical protein
MRGVTCRKCSKNATANGGPATWTKKTDAYARTCPRIRSTRHRRGGTVPCIDPDRGELVVRNGRGGSPRRGHRRRGDRRGRLGHPEPRASAGIGGTPP